MSDPSDQRDIIIDLVDSISKDGSDTPIHVIHYKMSKNSSAAIFIHFRQYFHDPRLIFYPTSPRTCHREDPN